MKRIIRTAHCLALLCLAFALNATLAQAAPDNPSLSFTLPSEVNLGDVVDLKARLTDSAGAPISGATVLFTVPATFFLGTTGDVVVARVNTDKAGLAEAQYRVRATGNLSIRAESPGSDRYAPTKASAALKIADAPGQQYVQHAGVNIPGLTGAGTSRETSAEHGGATGLASLWPMMSFWPIGVAVLAVWGLYAFAVLQIFRIALSPRVSNPIAAPSDRRSHG